MTGTPTTGTGDTGTDPRAPEQPLWRFGRTDGAVATIAFLAIPWATAAGIVSDDTFARPVVIPSRWTPWFWCLVVALLLVCRVLVARAERRAGRAGRLTRFLPTQDARAVGHAALASRFPQALVLTGLGSAVAALFSAMVWTVV